MRRVMFVLFFIFFIAADLAALRGAALAKPIMPGSPITPPGSPPFVAAFTISEGPEGTEEFFRFDFSGFLPDGVALASGRLLMCEIGTRCDPNDASKTDWSDVVTWAGRAMVTIESDPKLPSPPLDFGFGVEVLPEIRLPGGGDGVKYEATSDFGTITWTIVSDVPEPATFLLLGAGMVGMICCVGKRRQLG